MAPVIFMRSESTPWSSLSVRVCADASVGVVFRDEHGSTVTDLGFLSLILVVPYAVSPCDAALAFFVVASCA